MVRVVAPFLADGISSDVIGLFFPMKEVRCNNHTKVLVTPLRASFNKHPGKLNFEFKEAYDNVTKKINGFITQYCSKTTNPFTYIPFGTASPKLTFSCQMVLEVKKLKIICELF